ncbi:MAG: hypothetical protein DI498_02020 [Paracoccus denitrificans]|nr:MAG: hypothetical protein DI498_02020 [Paracoccus denitrificans]PZO85934.1 MAG: hypothetical protein DI633_02020 [Paracoccus denitrificans]
MIARLTLAVAAFVATVGAASAACEPGEAEFLTPSGKQIEIATEIAATGAARQQGLMGRTHLDPRSGMLFVYPYPQRVGFWMRNTLIPLDMIFMDATGTVRHVHAHAKPLDETDIPGNTPDDKHPERQFVLEISGGEAARLGIGVGARMRHAAVSQATAAAPCE